MRKCKKCKTSKQLNDFYLFSNNGVEGYRYTCIECCNLEARARQMKNRYWLKTLYGVSIEEYNKKYTEQDGRCDICKTYYPTLCVDHCHDTKLVRGLLCKNCNSGLGMFSDDKETIKQAYRYLKRHHP